MEIPRQDTFEDLVNIVKILRSECPWDREQTHKSISHLLIEEAYEVKEAIDCENDLELKKELGDILLHVLMHSMIAEQRKSFTFNDVVKFISSKLVQRHPHVFGDKVVKDSNEVKANWEQLKMKEGRNSIFDGMPLTMPALQRAERVQEKASKVGFDWENKKDVWKKVKEELNEFEVELNNNDFEKTKNEFGDLLFSLVNYSRFLNILPEEALHKTTNKFISRFKYIEDKIKQQGKSISESSLEEMDDLWNEAKNKFHQV
jgi:XTP/dITP diphosphohydrolase